MAFNKVIILIEALVGFHPVIEAGLAYVTSKVDPIDFSLKVLLQCNKALQEVHKVHYRNLDAAYDELMGIVGGNLGSLIRDAEYRNREWGKNAMALRNELDQLITSNRMQIDFLLKSLIPTDDENVFIINEEDTGINDLTEEEYKQIRAHLTFLESKKWESSGSKALIAFMSQYDNQTQ